MFVVEVCTSTLSTEHKAVMTNVTTNQTTNSCNKTPRRTYQIPDIRGQHLAKLRTVLSNYNWGSILGTNKSVTEAYEEFLEIIHGVTKLCIPYKQVTVRQSDPWFVTPLIKSLLRRRNSLYHASHIVEAENLAVKINKLISEEKSKAFSDVQPEDSEKLWKSVRKMATTFRMLDSFTHSVWTVWKAWRKSIGLCWDCYRSGLRCWYHKPGDWRRSDSVWWCWCSRFDGIWNLYGSERN